MAGLPALGTLIEKPEGTAHLTNGEVILLVRPSIIAN